MVENARYLGIDPGTHCGYAVLDQAGVWITSGVWDLKPNRHEGGGMRWVRLERYLRDLAVHYQPGHTYVAYEEVRRHAGTDAAHIYGGVVATLQRVCEGWLVPYLGIPVGTVKKLATGRGNAGKVDMVQAAQLRWGIAHVTDDNEADALWIGECLRQQLVGVEPRGRDD